MLNETLIDPDTNKDVLDIIKAMVNQLQHRSTTTTTSTTEKPAIDGNLAVLPNACLDITQLKIMPNDDAITARQKHGKLLFSIHYRQNPGWKLSRNLEQFSRL